VSYPGVYIQEVESDVRTIVGVDTATTAFVGRTKRGPINKPTVLNNFGDFISTFGGLWLQSALGYAVEDFFNNGGLKAVVVRVFKGQADDDSKQATFNVNGLSLQARDPGEWGNKLAARITYLANDQELNNDENKKGKVAKDVAKRYGVLAETLFTLTVRDTDTGVEENFEHLTVKDGPRPVKQVLEQKSKLVQVAGDPPAQRPGAHAEEYDRKKYKSVWDDPLAHTKAPEDAGGDDGAPPDAETIEGVEGTKKSGIYALEDTNIFNLLCIPPYNGTDVADMADVDNSIWQKAAEFCQKKRAMLLVDSPKDWDKEEAIKGVPLPEIGAHTNAVLYFPRIKKTNTLRDRQLEAFAPCGAIAGIMARTDGSRGFWKAPAGLDARLLGVDSLVTPLTDPENGELNPLGINCLRTMPAVGPVVWGARTLVGDDRLASQWKYLPVRRTALYIEESIYRSIRWAVFEPNDEPLWARLRLNIGVFMHSLFRQGAFQGRSPKEAYLVQCDSTTTTQADIDQGIVNVIVGFRPLKPAEFVVIYIKQLTEQAAA